VTHAGDDLTIQSTGMGGPSATVVLHDLAELGVRRAVRIGTCTSLGELELGQLVRVLEARTPDGRVAKPSLELPATPEAGAAGSIVSLDVLPRHAPQPEARSKLRSERC
jgi:uridine phosphorylase